jgi:exodeoxyribonuclease-3
MKVITANTNGIRAAARKGFFEWLKIQAPDFVCIQETKAQVSQLEDPIFHPEGYHCYYHDAEKKGYSGVAIYSKHKPDNIIAGMGNEEFDREGRYLEVQIGNLSVVSLYMPSGSSSEERQEAKYRCMDFFLPKMEAMKETGKDIIFCGDWNIAHKNEDIKNWRGNQKNSGFLPEERAWLDTLFDERGFVDAFRELEQEEHQYTWWSNRGQAWANNTGWRIDYHILTPSLKGTVQDTHIYKDERFSDHAPLIINYDYEVGQ